MEPQKILCFSAHPDDEVGGAGGFLLKRVRAGADIVLALACDGSSQKGQVGPEQERALRLEEFRAVADTLKAAAVFLDFPRYFPVDLQKTILPCVGIIRKYRPNIVLAPHRGERHFEHVAISTIVREACWIAKGNRFSEIGAPWLTDEFREYELDVPLPALTDLEDITDVIPEKEKLFSLYRSQLSNKDYLTAMRGLNSYRGLIGRCGHYAEAFRTARQLTFPSS